MTNETIYIDELVITVYRKKVKNINLRISRNGSISISANPRISLEKIEQYLISKKEWIYAGLNKINLNKLSNITHKPFEYIDGDVVSIQGIKYKLLNVESNINKVEIEENILYLYTSNFEKRKNTLDKYIKNLAIYEFEKSLDEMLNSASNYKIQKPNLVIRKMKSRWGSCNKKRNKITINLELIKVNKECLDYVVLHELIHFLESGHNKRFYNFMTVLMPDWKTRKKILNDSNAI